MVKKGSLILLPHRRPDQLIRLLALLQLLLCESTQGIRPVSREKNETGFFYPTSSGGVYE